MEGRGDQQEESKNGHAACDDSPNEFMHYENPRGANVLRSPSVSIFKHRNYDWTFLPFSKSHYSLHLTPSKKCVLWKSCQAMEIVKSLI